MRCSLQKLEGTTESCNRPVHSSPGFKVTGFSIAAPSTQTICLYSSSPMSAIDFDFFSQGFHTAELVQNEDHKLLIITPIYHVHASQSIDTSNIYQEFSFLLLHVMVKLNTSSNVWQLTSIWKSLLSYYVCPLSFMVKDCDYIRRTKINSIQLPGKKRKQELFNCDPSVCNTKKRLYI